MTRKILKLDWSQCLCHCTDSSGALTAFTEVSWRRLEESSRVRNDAIWRFVGKHWSDGPRGVYHRECYRKYTMPSSLKRVVREVDEASSSTRTACRDNEGESSAASVQRGLSGGATGSSTCSERRQSRRHALAMNKSLCVICQEEKKSLRDRRTEERTANSLHSTCS